MKSTDLTSMGFAAGTMLALSLVGPAYAQQPDPVLFDVPWIGYDTAVYPEGINPWAGETADLNGDGLEDFATVSWSGTPWLSILIADGRGGYLPPETHQIQLESLGLAIADFDGDGDKDIVVCDTGRFWEGFTVTIYHNDGEGGFTRGGSFDTGEVGPTGIVADDFNGDGWSDVAIAHDRYIESNNKMSVLLNDGAGNLHSSQVLTLSAGTRSIDAGDLDGDGDVDCVVGHESNRWTLVRNDGNGVFAGSDVFPGINAGSIPELPMVHIVDIDRDQDRDVFFSNTDTGGPGQGAVGLWRNHGDGTFASPQSISFNTYTGGGVGYESADVTGDGHIDVMVATERFGDWFLLVNDGNGEFLAPKRLRCGQAPIDVFASDLDGDSDLDLTVLARDSLEACVYLNPGDGSFVQPPVIDMVSPTIAPAFTTNLEAQDIDQDGDVDVAVGFRSDFSDAFGLSVRYNNGDGTFAPPVLFDESTFPESIALRDLNGDTWLDLLWIDADGRFRVRFNDGSGSFGARQSYHVFDAGFSDIIDAIDIDNDGDLDVIANAGFRVGISMNQGNGTFLAPMYHQLGSTVTAFKVGDLNGDGLLDLLTNTGAQGYPAESFGNGDGTFGASFTLPTGRDVRAFDIGDVDNDGIVDFCSIYNLDESGLGVRRGRGGGNFFAPELKHGSFDEADHTASMQFVDVNGDGNLDAVTTHVGAKDISFWQGNGDGTFQRVVRYGVGQPGHDLQIADFNGDGLLDTAVATQAPQGAWWYNAVVILPGIDPNQGGGSVEATLRDATFAFGRLVEGDVNRLLLSDDSYLRGQSQFGFAATEPNIVELIVGATTDERSAAFLDVQVEGKLNNPGGTTKVRLKNFKTNSFEQVGQYPLGTTERTERLEDIPSDHRIRQSDGRLELSLRQSVIATFSATGFETSFDHILISTHE